jgi:hypothetical protein
MGHSLLLPELGCLLDSGAWGAWQRAKGGLHDLKPYICKGLAKKRGTK